MLDSLFPELPTMAKFFIAFAAVLVVIGVTAWLIRRFKATRLGVSPIRGRQPRLAVIDAAAVDGRRRLILIRRDNTEHLLMIGGPSDIVVEQNIIRGTSATAARDLAAARVPSSPDLIPHADETTAGWPPHPPVESEQESLAPWLARSAPQEEPAAPEPRSTPEEATGPSPRPPRAHSIEETPSVRPPRPLSAEDAPSVRPVRTASSLSLDGEPPFNAARPQRDFRPLRATTSEPSIKPSPDIAPRHVAAPEIVPVRPEPSMSTAKPQPEAVVAPPRARSEASLSDMAQRLEAALRVTEPNMKAAPAINPGERPAPPPDFAAPPQPSQPAIKPEPVAPKSMSMNSALGSLEEEMANLLGRSPARKE